MASRLVERGSDSEGCGRTCPWRWARSRIAAIGPFVAPHGSERRWCGSTVCEAVVDRTTRRRPPRPGRAQQGACRRLGLLLLAGLATALGVAVGTAAGMMAAYFPGWRDNVVMRAVDVLLAFPQLVFALLLVSVLGDHLWLVVLAVGLSHAPQVARVVRSTALDVSERDYVKSVAIMGVRPSRVMSREILPNLVSPLMVETGLRLTYSIIIMAGLAFLGFGFQPPDPTWGFMIRENQIGVTSNLWAVVAPIIPLALLTIGVNTFTDAVTRVALGVEQSGDCAVTEALAGELTSG